MMIFFLPTVLVYKKDKINEFLLFCDDNFPSKILLKKTNEFELIDFLVKQSKNSTELLVKNRIVIYYYFLLCFYHSLKSLKLKRLMVK